MLHHYQFKKNWLEKSMKPRRERNLPSRTVPNALQVCPEVNLFFVYAQNRLDLPLETADIRSSMLCRIVYRLICALQLLVDTSACVTRCWPRSYVRSGT